MSVTFAISSDTVVIPNPAFPEIIAEPPRQQFGASGGGSHRIYQRGDSGKVIPLLFRRLTDADKSAFLTWIQTHANYMANAFSYTDPHAVVHTNMRFNAGSDWGAMFQKDNTTLRWSISLVAERDEGL